MEGVCSGRRQTCKKSTGEKKTEKRGGRKRAVEKKLRRHNDSINSIPAWYVTDETFFAKGARNAKNNENSEITKLNYCKLNI